MCPVCMVTVTAMIVSGLTSAGGLSTVALVKPWMRSTAKKSAQPTDSAGGRKGLAQRREFKTRETGK